SQNRGYAGDPEDLVKLATRGTDTERTGRTTGSRPASPRRRNGRSPMRLIVLLGCVLLTATGCETCKHSTACPCPQRLAACPVPPGGPAPTSATKPTLLPPTIREVQIGRASCR